MKKNKTIAVPLVLCLAAGTVSWPMPEKTVLRAYATDPICKEIDPLDYTYEIYPLVAPFNEYFFVKTDNPHPESFRFSDKDSPYSETSVIYNADTVYADVEYENEDIYRVNGGYIFKSFTTNGEGDTAIQKSVRRRIQHRGIRYTRPGDHRLFSHTECL